MAVYDDEEGVERDEGGRIAIPKGHDYAEDNATNRALDRQADETRRHGRDNINNAYSNWGKKPDSQKDGSSEKGASSSSGKKESNADSASALKDKEESVGLGYTGTGGKKSKGPKEPGELLASLGGTKSKLKKKILIAGAIAGGGAVTASIVFLALLPLKVEHFVQGIEAKFSATSQNAMRKETRSLFNRYMVTQVLPGINAGRCHSTIDANCVGDIDGSKNRVYQLWKGYKDARLEQKLATKYGLVFGSQGIGSNRFYVNLDGHNYNILDNQDVFSLEGTKKGQTAAEVRELVGKRLDEGLRDTTFWKQAYVRYKVWHLLENKYGVEHCLFACNIQNKKESLFNKWTDKKFAFKAQFADRVVGSLSENGGLIGQCILAGADFCRTTLDPAEPGDESRMSPAQKKIRENLLAAKAKFISVGGAAGSSEADAAADADKKINKLIDEAESLTKSGGVTKWVTSSVVSAMASKFTGEAAATAAGEAAGTVATKSIPVIGWIFTAGRVAHLSTTIGPMIKYMGYATSASGAIAVYSLFTTSSSEMKSGNTSANVQGQVAGALSDNTAYMQNVMENKTIATTSAFDGLLGKTYADGTATASSTDPCYQNAAMEAGSLLCPEENLSHGNDTLSEISKFADAVPGVSTFGAAIDKVGEVISGAIQPAFQAACTAIPGCRGAVDWAGGFVSEFTNWLTGELVTSPFNQDAPATGQPDSVAGLGLTPGRITNIAAMGAHALYSDSAQNQLGGAVLSPQAALQIQNEELQLDQDEFNAKPLFARMFDTSSSYSFVSRLAVSMPAGMTQSGVALSTRLMNPITSLGTLFSAPFSANTAFAASTTALSASDGINDTGYLDSQIPDQPDVFWDANCVSGPLAKFNASTGQLDVTDWLNKQTQDARTGQAAATTTNPCLLINSSVEADGALYGVDQESDDGTTATTASTTTATGSVVAGFPLKTTKPEMAQLNGDCLTKGPEMCDGDHPYKAYDIMANPGTEVHSLFDGKVVGVFLDKCPGRGVSIYSESLGVTVSYLHMNLNDAPQMANSQVVKAGDLIGHVGPPEAGCGTAHLHIDAAEGQSRPGCKREDCPAANQVIFTAGNAKIGLGKLLYDSYQKLPGDSGASPQ